MLSKTCLDAIEGWISGCDGLVPLEVSHDHPSRQTLANVIASHAELRGDRVEAVLGLRIGSIDRAHDIVQHGATPMDRYLHGVVHRIEGDFWNAKYWFRQVDDKGLLVSVGHEVISTLESQNLLESSKSLKLFDDQNRFETQNLVDAQAALSKKASSNQRELVQQIAQAEWNAIWKMMKLANQR
jgi:hypothetical protein